MDRIATIKRTKEILDKYQFRMKKNYGQNFMIVPKVPLLIANHPVLDKDATVIEVGPGVGALTQCLLEKVKRVVCYEIDKELIPILENELSEYPNLEIHNQDFLKVNLEDFKDEKIVIVSNLPYYLTSEIIIKALSTSKKMDVIAMMQKEVAKRILTASGGKEENELTLYSKYFAEVTKLTDVSKNDFFPRPNVDSMVLIFRKKDVPSEKFVNGIKVIFSQRRKTIYNNLKQYLNDEQRVLSLLDELNIEKNKRVEELDWETILKLIDKLEGQR